MCVWLVSVMGTVYILYCVKSGLCVFVFVVKLEQSFKTLSLLQLPVVFLCVRVES